MHPARYDSHETWSELAGLHQKTMHIPTAAKFFPARVRSMLELAGATVAPAVLGFHETEARR